MQTTEILCTLFKECYENHFFSILNIYTLNVKNTATSYMSNWYTQE